MSILDVTEDQIFQTLGKGRDPNFKQIEKVRPVVYSPKKTYGPAQPAKAPVAPEPVKIMPSPEIEEAISKLTAELSLLNRNVEGIQATIKLYMFMFTIALLVFIALGVLFIFR